MYLGYLWLGPWGIVVGLPVGAFLIAAWIRGGGYGALGGVWGS